jgi:inactivated superfamily I helicase
VQSKVYTLAPERPFLATLADGLLGITGEDPLQPTRLTILLPDPARDARLARRISARDARRREAATPLLLPRKRLIGDLDSDELTEGRALHHSYLDGNGRARTKVKYSLQPGAEREIV